MLKEVIFWLFYLCQLYHSRSYERTLIKFCAVVCQKEMVRFWWQSRYFCGFWIIFRILYY